MSHCIRMRLTLLTAFVVAATGLLPEAHAEQKTSPLEGQPAIRARIEMRRRRLEITPQLVVSTNQDFRHFVGGGAVIQYHINDWLGVALNIAGGGAVDSGLTANIDQQLKREGEGGAPRFQPTKEQFRAHIATTNLLLGAYLTLTPFSGKLAMFGAAYLRYDLYGIAGIGFQNLTNGWGSYTGPKLPDRDCMDSPNLETDPNQCNPANSGFKFSGNFGVGMHLYFNNWLGLNVELRDLLNSTNPAGLDVNGDRKVTSDDETIQNNLFVGVGLTFMLPIKAKVSD